MKTHYMNLHPSPFASINSGNKTIEMRLYDDRRKSIQTGDHIVFTNNESGSEITVEVVALYQYSSFEELYNHHSKESLGYTRNETPCHTDMLLYYTQEQIKQHGVLAIEIKVI